MKKLIFLIVVIYFGGNLYGQIDFSAKIMKISNYKIDLNSEFIDEEFGDGPYLYFDCIMKNISSDSIFLNSSTSNFYIEFVFKNIVFKEELNVLQWNSKKVVLPLASCEKINLIIGTNIFLGTNILEENKGDYTLELIEILPTLKIVYIDKSSHTEFILSNINSVELIP